ncbi:MAG: heavy metal-responsive transcriptional regulator [Timaviella obliquedivisa GSE-PSE-MK23-08B]|jgi:DNA-binding transcriptional MerR regulator|nr:heavy metal-responsive transcriptional regulator [Timaviella obliquedivisa GSE-PSE-MK23-08B]
MSEDCRETLLKIGEAALKSGLSVKTIRYYDEIGLLNPMVERSKSGYRLFKSQLLQRLAFIRRAQALGLHLSEVQQILTVHDQGELPCGEVKQHLEAKLIEVRQQIEALETLEVELKGILSAWQDQPHRDLLEQTICPNLQGVTAWK